MGAGGGAGEGGPLVVINDPTPYSFLCFSLNFCVVIRNLFVSLSPRYLDFFHRRLFCFFLTGLM